MSLLLFLTKLPEMTEAQPYRTDGMRQERKKVRERKGRERNSRDSSGFLEMSERSIHIPFELRNREERREENSK